MALFITDQCVNCDVCEPVCPNQAIYMGHKLYHIHPHRCTECVGHFEVPQCVEVCPVECILLDPQHPENQATLLQKFQVLSAVEPSVSVHNSQTPACSAQDVNTAAPTKQDAT